MLLKISLQLQASSQVPQDPNLFQKPHSPHTYKKQIYESQIPQSYFPTEEVLQKDTVLADIINTCIREKKKKKQPICV